MVIDAFKEEYEFLSNFAWVDGTTTEHHFQAGKTLDPVWREKILNAPSPGLAKKLGRQCPMREDWNDIRVAYMLELLRWKFSFPEFRVKLLNTGTADLVEGNWWGDTFWGVCKGVGENWLGRLLMQVREEIM